MNEYGSSVEEAVFAPCDIPCACSHGSISESTLTTHAVVLSRILGQSAYVLQVGTVIGGMEWWWRE